MQIARFGDEKNRDVFMSSNYPSIDLASIRMKPLSRPDLGFLSIGSKLDASDKELLLKHEIYCISNCTRDHLSGGVKNFHEGEPGFRYSESR